MLNSLMLTIILDEEVFVNYVKEGMWELCAAPECPAPKVNIEICRIYIYIYTAFRYLFTLHRFNNNVYYQIFILLLN